MNNVISKFLRWFLLFSWKHFLVISSLPHWLFRNVIFSFQILGTFLDILSFISNLILWWLENILKISSLWNLLRASRSLPWWMFCMRLTRIRILQGLGMVFYSELPQVEAQSCSKLEFLIFSFGCYISYWENVCNSPFSSVSFSFMYFATVSSYTLIYDCHVFLTDT